MLNTGVRRPTIIKRNVSVSVKGSECKIGQKWKPDCKVMKCSDSSKTLEDIHKNDTEKWKK